MSDSSALQATPTGTHITLQIPLGWSQSSHVEGWHRKSGAQVNWFAVTPEREILCTSGTSHRPGDAPASLFQLFPKGMCRKSPPRVSPVASCFLLYPSHLLFHHQSWEHSWIRQCPRPAAQQSRGGGPSPTLPHRHGSLLPKRLQIVFKRCLSHLKPVHLLVAQLFFMKKSLCSGSQPVGLGPVGLSHPIIADQKKKQNKTVFYITILNSNKMTVMK